LLISIHDFTRERGRVRGLEIQVLDPIVVCAAKCFGVVMAWKRAGSPPWTPLTK
jgi:hypothetical protein